MNPDSGLRIVVIDDSPADRARAHVRAERDAFLLSLSEALRHITDPQRMKDEAVHRLGRHLAVSRALYGEVDGDHVRIERGYVDGVPQADGDYRIGDDGAHPLSLLNLGVTVVVRDLPASPEYSVAQKMACAQLDVAAQVTVPLRRNGDFVAFLGVYHAQPRHWTDAEVELIEETATRTWQAVQSAQSEARHRDSERRLQLALHAGGMGVWRWDAAQDNFEVDAALAALTGMLPDDPARTSARQFRARIHADDLPAVSADVERVLREGGHYRHEFRYRCPDGRDIWLAGQAMAVEAEGRSGRSLVGIHFDVTDRRRDELELRTSRARLSQLIELMSSFTAVLRGPELVFEMANAPYYLMTGRDASILGRTVRQAFPELADQPFPALLDRVYDTGVPFEAKSMPVRLARRVGEAPEELFVDFAYIPLHDAAGTVNGILMHGHDRTEQVRAEQALLRSQRELQTLADNTPDILTRFDRHHRHVFVNQAVQAATGQPPVFFLGKTNRELGMPPHLCDRWESALDSVFETGQPSEDEFEFMSPHGLRHHSARLVPERSPQGTIDFVLGVTRDVTKQKTAELLLRDADRRKDEFLATLAHELRNPLAPIRNGLAILRHKRTPEQLSQTVAIMERQLSQLVNLVDDLLDLSRVNLDKIELRLQRLSVAEVVDAAVEACRPALDAKRHALTVDPFDATLAIDADRTRMVQVLANLLTNAVKYTEPGGQIRLGVSSDGTAVEMRVADNGVGLAAEVLPTLWSLFTQVRDTLDKAQGGLGIGLSLVKRLVEMHRGSVSAASEGLGKGSVFTVRIPLAPASASGSGSAMQPDAAPPLALESGLPEVERVAPQRVLIVDDNQDSAMTMSMLVQSLGHITEVAYDGLQALAKAGAFQPDLVLLDIGLPGMDGYEVARLLREDAPGGGPVLVAVTGWGTQEDKRRARVAGFDHHLTKPVRMRAIEELLAGGRPTSNYDTTW